MMIPLKDIASAFDLEIVGNDDVFIKSFGSVKQQERDLILWVKNQLNLNKINKGCIIVNAELELPEVNDNITFLITKNNPRLTFARILHKYFAPDPVEELKDHIAEHRENSKIFIGNHTFIGANVKIGEGTIIHPNVVIHKNTIIGKNCIISSHVSIGTEGLGLEFDDLSNEYIKFPQLGGVIIEDNVEIGPLSTIRRSALDNTIIKKGTKIGSLVNIGHNCVIGRNCILTCQIVTAGSSLIGDNVFMGVNSIVKNGVNVGNNVTLGQGAVVTKNIPDGSTFIGNPAEDIKDYKLWIKLKKHLYTLFDKDLNDKI